MPEKIIRSTMVRYDGVFDLPETYRWIVSYFTERNFKYYEKKWKEKEASPVGREVTIDMQFEREETEYVKSEYVVNWRSWDTHEVQIQEGGKTKTKTRARVQVDIRAKLDLDWQGYGEKGGAPTKALAKFFFEKLFLPQISFEDNTRNEVQAFANELKEHFGLHIAEARA